MKKPMLLLVAMAGLGGCGPAEADTLAEAARAVATRAASSSPDRLLVVAGTFGDTAMTFATRQALVTAGIVVQDAPLDVDSMQALLQFVSAAETEGGWRLRTSSTASALDASASEGRIEWLVECSAGRCEVSDSTTW